MHMRWWRWHKVGFAVGEFVRTRVQYSGKKF